MSEDCTFTLPDGRKTEAYKMDLAEIVLSDIDYLQAELLAQLESMRSWVRLNYRHVTERLGAVQFIFKNGHELDAEGIKDSDLLAVVLDQTDGK